MGGSAAVIREHSLIPIVCILLVHLGCANDTVGGGSATNFERSCTSDTDCYAGESCTADVCAATSLQCAAGDTRACGSRVGECEYGVQNCLGGQWSDCMGDVRPAPEKCNGLDDDCDGEVPADEVDQDADGVRGCDGDCDDTNAAVHQGTAEKCDGFDNDCDGTVPDDEQDSDRDGYRACDGDCDDNDAQRFPGNPDMCDAVDNDCDESTLDGFDELSRGLDCDGDDADACQEGTYDCLSGTITCMDLSDDTLDICDGIDNDCLPASPDGSGEVWFASACDGADSDLCPEGVYQCTDAAQQCSDSSGSTQDLCDGIDNDCDPTTADGSAEAWMNSPCDGPDSDLCAEGVLLCSAGAQTCSDATADDVDTCDGIDNDCDPLTADGSLDTWYHQPCDGLDSDTCYEGVYQCVAGVTHCDDTTGDNLDLCDGLDNDCNPLTVDGEGEVWFLKACDGDDLDSCAEGAMQCVNGGQSCGDISADNQDLCDGFDNDCDPLTADGAHEPWLGGDCDGPDLDLCAEGTSSCIAGSKTCSDIGGDLTDICDGLDNDCNPATADGSGEAWYEQNCDGADTDLCEEGTFSCQAGTQLCTDTTGDAADTCDGNDNDCDPATLDGSAEIWLGTACDGNDADLCAEGEMRCTGGTSACSDTSSDNAEVCDGIDNDCDGSVDNIACNCADGATQACGTDEGECSAGTQTCAGGIWSACSDQGPTAEVCDGLDNDCDPLTPDGNSESWMGIACDGPDGDACAEGVYACVVGVQSCSDTTANSPEVCDGVDNDCDASTVDGSEETWFTKPCDGPDGDLCAEGVYDCTAGVQTCSDNTGAIAEICDGFNNDCNIATADGSGEPWSGSPCDGPDADLCDEGTYSCVAGVQECSDNTPDNTEVCDAADNDCDPSTGDGAHEPWFNSPCDGPDSDACKEGTLACTAGAPACSDSSGDTPDICDGADNDCDPSTVDGSDEAWFAVACDGADSDSCSEGAWTCMAAAQFCTDTTADSAEVCDGIDNDCDPSTIDGKDEPWFLAACDGADSDLCNEGAFNCVAGSQSCGDSSDDNIEFCDAVDNDCNAATADGSGESWYGAGCDGPDSDSCPEGSLTCGSGTKSCSDLSGDSVELCDGIDNDCDPATTDGSDEAWFMTACDGPDGDLCVEGSNTCVAGLLSCGDNSGSSLDTCDGFDNDCNPATGDGIDDLWYGKPCDGADTDLCTEGSFSCNAGTQACSDATGDNVEICDGLDNDCNGATDEIACSCVDGASQACGTDDGECVSGVQMCVGGVWGACSGQGPTAEICDGLDNDCDPGTPDGGIEPWIGAACDGSDTDLCAEGVFSCAAGGQLCSDMTGDALEACDGIDNDCNGATADGADELWLGALCDGADADLCNEGALTCASALQTCSDQTGDSIEMCDGTDNDCNSATADGSGEAWLGAACDGSDVDTCLEGTFSCTAGSQSCSDLTGDNVELCDGIDNDCVVATADGADETWLGTACDGSDADFCDEGILTCAAGAQACTDNTGDNLDLCDGADNDCDPATADGDDELWIGALCDGLDSDLCQEGTSSCVAGAQNCSDMTGDLVELCDGADNDCNGGTSDGSDEPWYGATCDGADADLCDEGTYGCVGALQTCDDVTTDTADVCDGIDNDCDPGTPDGVDEATYGLACDGPDLDFCDEGAFACDGSALYCTDATDDTCACDPSVDADRDGSDQCADCRDTVGSVFPGAVETCNGIDDDCDGFIDEDFDVDGDTYSVCSNDPFLADCDDTSAGINPGMAELCNADTTGNGVDENCNGYTDELCTPCDPSDTDGDGFSQCYGDCDDTQPAAYPGATETCDGIDNDCNVFTVKNCGPGEECDRSGTSPDLCEDKLSCSCWVDKNGDCKPGATCDAKCNSSITGPRGIGCLPNEVCSTDYLASGAMHACAAGAIGATNTKMGGVACNSDSECRSGNCYGLFTGQGQKNYCYDYCSSDAHCPVAGTVCRVRSVVSTDGRCWPTDRGYIGTDPVGTACTSDSACDHGRCLTDGPERYCSAPCCGDSDCPSGFMCSLETYHSYASARLAIPASPTACVDDIDCPANMYCDQEFSACGWARVSLAPQCMRDVPGQSDAPPGAACTQNSDCRSNYCEATQGICIEICCSDDACPANMSCTAQKLLLIPEVVTTVRVCVADQTGDVLRRK